MNESANDSATPGAGIGPQGNLPAIGRQYARTWEIGNGAPEVLLDFSGTEALLSLNRVSVSGPVYCRVTWGTGQANQLVVRAPFVWNIPGKIEVVAYPINTAVRTEARLSAVPVSGGTHACVRQFVAPGAIDERAAWFTALNACALVVNGTAVALTASQRIPLVPVSTLVGGAGIVEFEL